MATFDLILAGALVHDGTGAPPVCVDVGVAGDRIVAMGDLAGCEAETRRDCTGLALAPGFIDSHTHDDGAVLARPDCAAKLSQGVTTVLTGCCGLSLAPLPTPRAEGPVFRLLGGPEAFRYPTFAAYGAAVDAAEPAVNVAAQVGHNTLRAAVMADFSHSADAAERSAMAGLLDEAVEAGAVALSFGTYYAPGQAAPTDELAALASRLPEGMPSTHHVRDEYAGVLEAVQEALAVGRASGRPVVLSHHKTAGPANWGRTVETLGAVAAAQDVDVYLDAYPYTAGSTLLDPDIIDGIEVLITWCEPHPEAGGQRLSQIARTWECTEREAALRLRPAGAVYFQMREDDVERVLRHPRTMVGSDGLPMDPRPHPRLWGTFPRFLGRLCRDGGMMDLAEGIRRVTSLPASVYGLSDRGVIRAGAYADLVLFDPGALLDRATYETPQLPSAGVRAVYVNGRDALAGARAGRFLRRGR